MRKSQIDKHNNGKRNLLNAPPFGAPGSNFKDANYGNRSVKYSTVQEQNYLQRSVSADNVVIRSRGFKPSDRHDPTKRNFLENLTSKILHFDMESGERTPINLKKFLTPASDSHEMLQTRNKKMYASSYFYAPTHPTVEDQVELARRISLSLSDVKNMKSKGQSMYVNRKKRSVKWIHDGNGIEDQEEPPSPIHKDKIPLKCMMNPNGKVLDIHGIQALGEEVNISPMPSNPEKLFDIVRDLNNQRGRGAEIFAKRRKRSEKWVVDRDQPQTPTTPMTPKTPMYSGKMEINENMEYPTLPPLTTYTPTSTIDTKPFYNPFAVDLSLDGTNPPSTGKKPSRCNGNECRHSKEVKKIYLREVAVGTDEDYEDSPNYEKSRRGYYESCKDRRCTNGFANNPGMHQPTRQTRRYDNCPDNPANKRNYCGPSNSNNRDMRNACNATNRDARNSYPGGKDAWNSYGKDRRNSYDNSYAVSKDPRNSCNAAYNAQKDARGWNKQRNGNERAPQENHRGKMRNGEQPTEENEENEYTPVPVKQLIQEFEKTCRPVMQYKQISPKVIPIVQQCPVDNDITRFFENRNTVKYEEEEAEEEEDYPGIEQHEVYADRGKMQPRNGYPSTDETECTSDSSESEDGIFHSLMPMNNGNVALMNGNHDYSLLPIEGYGDRRMSITSQELENYYRNGDVKFVNSDSEVPVQAKSLLLSMVASQDQILETIKNLQATPVLDNLLSVASPECTLDTANADVGNKLTENNTYKGPKISSFNNLMNYNTAPRGWDQSQAYYRPITFQKPQDTIVYSDF